jgi:pimeloyl-ACP methyl ester carboxylesterase
LVFYNLTVEFTDIPLLIKSLGFEFATTSYRQNGLAVLEGVQDIQELVLAADKLPAIQAAHGPKHTYMIGGSEGGLITTLAIEQHPELFSGAMAACGPIGDFQAQLNYIGNFRVLFDYFFPGVLPGTAASVPQDVITGWDAVYLPRIRAATAAAPDAVAQLLAVSHAAFDPADPTSAETTVEEALWYGTFTASDAIAKLGGIPFDNRVTHYTGSANDELLNRKVERVTETPQARRTVSAYQTSGQLTRPLVTIHTSQDPIIPVWHEPLYATKAKARNSAGQLAQFTVNRYNHCNITAGEALYGFVVLLLHVAGNAPAGLVQRSDVQAAKHSLSG